MKFKFERRSGLVVGGLGATDRRPAAPVNSSLVNGQNYYTAITRARFGVKLWTEDPGKLVEKLARYSGEKTSALEGLGRLDRDRADQFASRHSDAIIKLRASQMRDRSERRDQMLQRSHDSRASGAGLAPRMAMGPHSIAEILDRFLTRVLDQNPHDRTSASPDTKVPQSPNGETGIDR